MAEQTGQQENMFRFDKVKSTAPICDFLLHPGMNKYQINGLVSDCQISIDVRDQEAFILPGIPRAMRITLANSEGF